MDTRDLSKKVIEIAAGEAHTLALSGDGNVYSWGRGTFGRLGNGTELDQHFPSKIEFNFTDKVTKIVAISAGAYHSLALADDGSIWSWGYNTYGQLGVDGENSSVPLLVKMPVTDTEDNQTPFKISSVKAGGMMSLAIDNLGSLWIWGNCPVAPTPTPLPVDFHGQHVVKVACGSEHIVALVNGDNDLLCYSWGSNSFGQLGLGDTEMRPNPQIVEKVNPGSPYQVACGAFHTCVLTYYKRTQSLCWTFGRGNNGQLGQGTTRNSLCPEIVDGLPENLELVSVDCGLFHTSVVSSSGCVWSWGMQNGQGLCPEATFTEGDGGDALSPRVISNLVFSEPVQVACGAAHTLILANNGFKIWSWGRGKSGVLGNSQEVDFFSPKTVLWPPQNDDGQNGQETVVGQDLEEIREVEKKLSVMSGYASILHGCIFGKPFDENKDIPLSLRNSGTFDITKEWENMLESCDRGKLVRLQMFYRDMLAGVEDKMMKHRIHEIIKEYVESSTPNTSY